VFDEATALEAVIQITIPGCYSVRHIKPPQDFLLPLQQALIDARSN
jgi:hypothetical protein